MKFRIVWNKLKLKWGINSDVQVLLILVVFAATGSTVVGIKGWFFQVLGFEKDSSSLIRTIAYLLFIFPAYQVLLLGYGFLFGQFNFFWKKEKMLVQRIGSLFKNKQKENNTD